LYFKLHWNNPKEIDHYTDSSGYKFYMTPKLRPNNAGVIMIGQWDLHIPPQIETYTAVGTCGSDCVTELITDEIKVTKVYNHMHLLGKRNAQIGLLLLVLFTIYIREIQYILKCRIPACTVFVQSR